MNVIARIFLVSAATFWVASAWSDSLPNAIRSQLPARHGVLDSISGDLNHDGRTDYVVVARAADEQMFHDSGKEAPRRPLLVFFQTAEGTFDLVARNDRVVLALDEGGQCDPFADGSAGLALKGRYFTVQHEVACGQHWTDYTTFKYSESLRKILFHKRIIEGWDFREWERMGGRRPVVSTTVVSAEKNKPIELGDYIPKP